MFRIVISLLAFVYVSLADVDYWGISKKEVKKDIPVKIKKSVDIQGQKTKEPTDNELLEASIKWYLKKLKKEKSPVEYYYFINPEKYKNAYWKWLSWIQDRTNRVVNPVIAFARNERLDVEKAVRELKKRGYEIMYFYSPTCPYCNASKPEVERLENYFKVYRIDITKDVYTARRWNINVTPTYIAVSPVEQRAYRITGYHPYTEVIYYFYRQIKND